MDKKSALFFTVIILIANVLTAQNESGAYGYLDFSQSSRLTALGGYNVSAADNDLNFAFQNPATLNSKTHNVLALNFSNYLADIMYGTAIYSRAFSSSDFAALGIQYVDYGNFRGADNENGETGSFSAKDFVLNLSYSRRLSDKLSIGVTVKPTFSAYEQETRFGLGADAGLHYADCYADSAERFSAGLVFRNIGSQLKGFESAETDNYVVPLPFNIILGGSAKLKHAPLRFSMTLHNLQKWNLGDQTNFKKFDMAMRHVILGIDFVPSKNFYVTLGYNHRRAAELRAEKFKSIAGFSFGAGVKVSKFRVGFGMAQYQTGNYNYHFSMATSLSEFGL